MAGVVPNNYVNTEMVDNYCFDSCVLKYNYQPISVPNLSNSGDNYVYQIEISNPDNYKCKFSNDKYKLTSIFIILNNNFLRHSYERYSSGIIKGEFILKHVKDDGISFLNICIAIKGNSDNNSLDDIFSSNDNVLNINEYIVAKAYNYYDSNDPLNIGGDKNTHWIVFDANQASIMINDANTSDNTTQLTKINLPKAPSKIESIKYHERGPQYIETTRIANCSKIVNNLGENIDSSRSQENNILENGFLGQKNPMIVSLLIFIFFIICVVLFMVIAHIFKNTKLDTIKNAVQSTRSIFPQN